MKWFSNIKDLQYYTQPKGVSCYCEQLVYPSDMILQGTIPAGQGSGNYTINIEAWSPDGLSVYETVTSYFDYYFAVNPVDGLHFFNARLKSLSASMCSHQCFLIRVTVANTGSPGNYVFSNWTERYCVNDCCDTAKGINISQDGLAPLTEAPVTPTTVPVSSSKPTGDCGEPLIRIISKFDCIDKFTGDFFGTPDVVLSGSANFEFVKITSMRGRIVRRPRDIKREISYNCKLQSAESTAVYLLEGFEYFPDWKMFEIEGQLHANHIWVDDYTNYKEYRYSGGMPFKQVHKCFELFKLEATLEDCTQRQIFGCGTCNTTGSLMYAVPVAYEGGTFFDDAGVLIAEDYEGLLVYFRGLNGVTEVADLDTDGMDCEVYKVFEVKGPGHIPRPFYYDSLLSANKVYGKMVSALNELCSTNGPVCKKPIAGTAVVADMVCNTPETGEPVVTDITPTDVAIVGYNDWVEDEAFTNASVYRNEVRMSIKVTNATITEDPEAIGEPVDVLNEIIGVIGDDARPPVLVMLLHDNNSVIPEGLILTIDSHGIIKASGSCTAADSESVTIELENLIYNI